MGSGTARHRSVQVQVTGDRAAGSPYGPVVNFVDCVGLIVIGLEISGGEQGLLFSYSTAAPSNGGLYLSDNYLHDIRGTLPGGNPLGWGSALGLNASIASTEIYAYNISVVSNLFNSSDVAYQNCITAQTHGGCVWPGGAQGGYLNTDSVLWSGNVVNHVSFNSAFFAFTANTVVDGNTFLDNSPGGLFALGTTDIIVGSVGATVSLTNNEIANRGEFKGGPDGCAIDLEDSSTGVVLSGNYISKSFGAAIMLFAGTGNGSKDISLVNNTLLFDGCNQTGGDHGLIAFLHAGQTGTVANNRLATCPWGGVVYNGDTSGFTFSGNTVYSGTTIAALLVDTPVVTVTDAGLVTAVCATPNAVLRYTLDGSRVLPTSPVFGGGVVVGARATAVLVKAFAPGMIESAVAGGIFSTVA
jgi:hypothetical protein